MAWLYRLTLAMRSFWSDPYLWVHLAGLAAFPLFLEGCLVGFAIGDPIFPIWLELLLVFAAGSLPILWMQWQRPFYIFSLVAVSLKPAALTDDQRKLLTLFKLPRNRVLAGLAAVALLFVLKNVYAVAPIAASSVSFLPTSHGLGLLIAAVAFFACNLFVQVPLSVASVMLSSDAAFARLEPYPFEQVRQNFTLIGLQLNQILPPVIPEPKPTIVPASTAASIASTQVQTSVEPLTSDLWAEASTSIPEAAAAVSDAQTPATDEIATAPLDVSMPEVTGLPEENSTQEDSSEAKSIEEHSSEGSSPEQLPSEEEPS
ncbi:MAG: low-complexity tail membrane protein [Leptolyngbya sp. BL-A-14]